MKLWKPLTSQNNGGPLVIEEVLHGGLHCFTEELFFLIPPRFNVVLKDGDPNWEMSMPDDDQHSLRFFWVGKGDVGELTCEVSNQHGYDHCFISLELAGIRCSESHVLHLRLQSLL